jgi:WD40 repeat protein/serine/threonine protein kinase
MEPEPHLMNEPTAREEALFTIALGKSGAEREAFLQRECGSDLQLRQRVEALLAAHEQREGLLATDLEIGGVALNSRRIALSIQPIDKTPEEEIGHSLGHYKLLEKIGEGGCGVVYVAEQSEPVRRRVALKVIKLGMDTKQVIARFEAERQALAMMDHPNIAKVLDAGATETGRPFFVMELVRGIRITDYCDQAKLGTRERLALFIQVCHAIQHAHQKGIIHRDIKPSNILVTLHDGVPVPKVIDFGIAKATEGRLTDVTVYTQLHQFIGTPAYMSPEQAEMSGLDIDTRSDIYSLGVLLYELLAGTTPFDANKLMASGIDAMRKTIREEEPARPSTRLTLELKVEVQQSAGTSIRGKRTPQAIKQLIELLKGDLDWIVMKCIEKDRTRRYETANGLAADLRRHLENEPVVARPPSSAYRLQKAIRRNKTAFAATAAVALTLFLAAIISGWQAIKATHARKDAVRLAEESHHNEVRAERETLRANQERQDAEYAKAEMRRNLYASQMGSAATAIQDLNLARAGQLLSRWFPNSTNASGAAPDSSRSRVQPEDLREFTWRYLWGQAQGAEEATLEGHFPQLSSPSLVASPDGKFFATWGADERLVVWGVGSLKPLLTVTNCFGPGGFTADSSGYVIGKMEGLIGVVKLRSGEFQTVLERPPTAILLRGRNLLVFNNDGEGYESFDLDPANFKLTPSPTNWLATANRDLGTNWFHYIDSRNGRWSTWIRRDERGLGQHYTQVIVWDAVEQKERISLFSTNGVRSFTFSKDSRFLAAGENGTAAAIYLLDLEHPGPPRRFQGHNGSIRALRFSSSGSQLASGGGDHTVKLWDVATGLSYATLKGHSSGVTGVAFLDNDRRLVSADKDDTIKLWDLTRIMPDDHLEGLGGNLAFSPDGKWLGGSLPNGRVGICSVEDLRVVTEIPDSVRVLRFGSDPKTLFVLHRDRVAFWDFNRASPRELSHLKLDGNPIWGMDVAPDGRSVLIARDGEVQCMDFSSGDMIFELARQNPGMLKGLIFYKFAPDGKSCILVANDGSGGAVQLSSRDGSLLRALRPTYHFDTGACAFSFSPDGHLIAFGDIKGSDVQLWDSEREGFRSPLQGHSQPVTATAFSPDGRTLASGSRDGTIRLWSPTMEIELATLHFNPKAEESNNTRDDRIEALAFSPDGKTLAASSSGGTLRLFRALPLAEISSVR